MLKRDDQSTSGKQPQLTLLRASASVRRWRTSRASAHDRAVAALNHDNPQLSEAKLNKIADDVANNAVKLSPSWESTTMSVLPILKRTVGLTLDAILLTIASPFFAIWWLSRVIRRYAEPKQ